MTLTEDLDTLAARALTASESERAGGWLLRATPGSSLRRITSALPVGAPPLDVGLVESWYGARGMTPLIAITPNDAGSPYAALDAQLEAAGWAAESATDVLVGDPDTVLDGLGAARPAHAVVPGELVEDSSLDPVVPLVTAGGGGRATIVLQERWSLMRGLEVDPALRRQGVAAALVRAWARLAEGRGLYLQVHTDNAPAQALYAAAGFTRSHGYHYRRAPAGTR